MQHKFLGVSLALTLLAACASVPRGEVNRVPAVPLATWIENQRRLSLQLMQRNISPEQPKNPGGVRPIRGIVVAGLGKKDPDYYFHWIRDSAIVMGALVEGSPKEENSAVDLKMADFLQLSEKLQKSASLGEPRFNVDGTVDTLPWSRPQYDGPALRALTVMRYLESRRDQPLKLEIRQLAERVIKTDLEFIATVTRARGFDMWEEYRGDNYNTRLAQLAALEKGPAAFKTAKHLQLIDELRERLDDHWDAARGFLRSQLAIVATDGYTAKKTDLDSAVIVSVMEADRDQVTHSVLDPHVQATVLVLEDLFRQAYPINRGAQLGLGYGRYFGDVYYGGNPWPLITSYYARFYYRLARLMLSGKNLVIGPANLAFINGLLPVEQRVIKDSVHDMTIHVAKGHKLFEPLIQALRTRGDAIMSRLQAISLADGDFYEQFDKIRGTPVSARGLGWSHAAFLEAVREREYLNRVISK